MNGRVRLHDPPVCGKIQTSNGMLEQVQVAVRVHGRDPHAEEGAALRRRASLLRVDGIEQRRQPQHLDTAGLDHQRRARRDERNLRIDRLDDRLSIPPCRCRVGQNAGSMRSTAASRLPPFENATVMYSSPRLVPYDTSVTVTASCWLT